MAKPAVRPVPIWLAVLAGAAVAAVVFMIVQTVRHGAAYLPSVFSVHWQAPPLPEAPKLPPPTIPTPR